MKNKIQLTLLLLCLSIISCKKKEVETPAENTPQYNLVFKYHFDKNQARLNNFGQPSTVPSGHGAQSPDFRVMSSHYIELAQDSLTPLTYGKILYRAPETTAGGSTAIDFSQENPKGEGETFFSTPLKDITPGTYKWLRVSLAYQNYDIRLRSLGFDLTGTISSFIGFNTYITNYKPKNHTVTVNSNKLQGYWGFELDTLGVDTVFTGDASNTTVPNPLSATSPIPAGSCVVTGAFPTPLIITGNETRDIVITVSLSVNNSFEWSDAAGNNIYEPPADVVTDMGIRGLIPFVN